MQYPVVTGMPATEDAISSPAITTSLTGKLKNAVNQLYRPGSFIGDGGTASIIKFEKATGLGLGKGGKNHLQKGIDMIKYLERVARSEKLSPGDRKLLRKLKNNLLKAVKSK